MLLCAQSPSTIDCHGRCASHFRDRTATIRERFRALNRERKDAGGGVST